MPHDFPRVSVTRDQVFHKIPMTHRTSFSALRTLGFLSLIFLVALSAVPPLRARAAGRPTPSAPLKPGPVRALPNDRALDLPETGWRSLSREERIRYQRAIEKVYWGHRKWVSATPKPEFEEAVPDAVIEAKVDETLRQSEALERLWKSSVSVADLQTELENMVNGTKMPEGLAELFDALDRDPVVIAEMLARPAIVGRSLRQAYAYDDRFHGELKQRVRAALGNGGSATQLKFLGGQYHEVEFVRQSGKKGSAALTGPITLDDTAWREQMTRFASEFAPETLPAKGVPVGVASLLQEDEDRFYIQSALGANERRIRIATVEWKKTTFDEWWREAKAGFSGSFTAPVGMLAGVSTPKNFAPNDDKWFVRNEPDVPTPRIRHTAVWTGVEMIIWGGVVGTFTSGVPVATGSRYNPITNQWTATRVANSSSTVTDGAPQDRTNHTAVWTGSKMIIWGGAVGTPGFQQNVNSGATYDPVMNVWKATRIDNSSTTVTDGAPFSRFNHTAVWSSTASRMVIWGGNLNTPGGLTVSTNTGGIYDPEMDKWTATATTGAPETRTDHVAVSTGGTMIVFGGFNNNGSPIATGGILNVSGNSWTATQTTGAPLLFSPAAAWSGTELIIWGSLSGSTAAAGGARYNPTANSWTTLPTANQPSLRTGHTAVWTGTEFIVWGGREALASAVNTGGRYNPTTNAWTPTSTVGAPSGRELHTAVFTTEYTDPANTNATKYMIVWGGLGGGRQGGRYDPATDTWNAVAMPNITAPEARENHTAINTGTEMIVWGGTSFGTQVSTGGRYNFATNTWTPTSTVGAPTYVEGTGQTALTLSPFGHTAIWTGTEMIIWGGRTNVGGRYNPLTDTWTATRVAPTTTGGTDGAPGAREDHTAIWTGTKMIVWGGRITTGTGTSAVTTYLNTGAQYDPATDLWSPTRVDPTTTGGTDGAPAARAQFTAIWTGTEMIVWGGFSVSIDSNNNATFNLFNSGARYNPTTNLWTATRVDNSSSTATDGAPAARFGQTAVWTGTRMIIWGGSNGNAATNTGGLYDPAMNVWSATSTTNAPTGRNGHTAVWTGAEMIVWGDAGNTGGRYNPTRDFWRPTDTTNAPAIQTNHTAIWDDVGKRMYVWGGRSSGIPTVLLGAYTAILLFGDTIGIYRPSAGSAFLRNSNTTGNADLQFQYGSPSDVPLAGDWNGDGFDSLGVFRNGIFLLRNSNSEGFADIVIAYGAPTDIPLAGDWDGDGIDTIGVFRPSTQEFFLRNSNTPGAPDLIFRYGDAGDLPIVGDWNGDGIDTVGIRRGITFFLRNANSTGNADISFVFGSPDDLYFVGDFDGDRIETVAVYRAGTVLIKNTNTGGNADIQFTYGAAGDIPLAGDWDNQP
jgi:hypothetical protein